MSRSAESIEEPDGRQYHIGLAKDDVASRVILVGDPMRANKARDHFFDSCRVTRSNREYLSHTGTVKGREVTVMATGMGADNTEIAVMELLNLRQDLTLIRVGSSGALQDAIEVGDLIISTGSVRLENTTAGFVEDGYPAVAHHEVVLALISAAEQRGHRYHVGLTATASGFYGWQGRREQPIVPRDPDLWKRLKAQNVQNLEMEASALFTLGTLGNLRTGAVCAAFANRPRNVFISPDTKESAELRALEVGFTALDWLDKMDQQGGRFHLR